MGNLNKIANKKLQYLAKPLVLGTPLLPHPDPPANLNNATNVRRQKLIDDWGKANELSTARILVNLSPHYKHLVRDDAMTAGEQWLHFNAKLCVVSASSKDIEPDPSTPADLEQGDRPLNLALNPL